MKFAYATLATALAVTGVYGQGLTPPSDALVWGAGQPTGVGIPGNPNSQITASGTANTTAYPNEKITNNIVFLYIYSYSGSSGWAANPDTYQSTAGDVQTGTWSVYSNRGGFAPGFYKVRVEVIVSSGAGNPVLRGLRI